LRWPSLRFLDLAARLGRLIEEAMTSSGLDTREFAILALLVDASGGPLARQTIASRLGRDRTTIAALVDTLWDKGLVECDIDPEDRRVHSVHLTHVGNEVFHSAVTDLEGVELEFFGPLPAETQEWLSRILLILRMRPTGATS
jgi:DNA-binding MarR family transcriptional regulator